MSSILVVGGSVSGLFTAKFILEGSSIDVELVECKSGFGENIVCAGGLASYMIKMAGVNISDEFIASKVRAVRFYSPSFDSAEIRLEKEYGVVLYRDRWEKALGDEIKALGAKVHFKSKSISFKGHDYIIGCDGISGVTRRILNLKPLSPEDIHIAIQAVCRCRSVPDDAISMFFGSAVAERGYGWAFPIGGSEFRVGLGIPLSISRRLIDSFRYLVSKIDAKVLEKPRCKLIPTAHPMESLVFGNILLVGDAGLQTDPATGGGIGPAIIGARCAAEAIIKGKHKLYDSLWKGHLYRRNRTRYALKQILCEMNDSEFEMLIDLLKDFKPISESLGVAMIHLIIELGLRNPKFLTKHKVLRRMLRLKIY